MSEKAVNNTYELEDNNESIKQALMGFGAVVLLVGFVAIGIAHIFKPDYFINRSAVRRVAACLPNGIGSVSK